MINATNDVKTTIKRNSYLFNISILVFSSKSALKRTLRSTFPFLLNRAISIWKSVLQYKLFCTLRTIFTFAKMGSKKNRCSRRANSLFLERENIVSETHFSLIILIIIIKLQILLRQMSRVLILTGTYRVN